MKSHGCEAMRSQHFILIAVGSLEMNNYMWRGAREAEGARLEIVCTPKRCTVGSNPTLSARYFI